MSWAERDLRHIWHPCSQMKDYEDMPPIVIERGEGVNLYDTEGKRYLDVISSWWCNLLGHCNERIGEAVKRQIDRLEHVIFCNFSHKPAIILCEKLARILPRGLSRFHFTDNGSSAVEAAMKMSFQYHFQTGSTGRRRFMALTGAYHGETMGALSACGCGDYSDIYKPILTDVIRVEGPDCYRCKYGLSRDSCSGECFEAAEAAFEKHGREVCAFLVEPILQGAAGMRIYPPVYLKKLKKACEAYNILLIADEIATGFGRTGKMFACSHAGITPDIMCISKGLTGGYMPMAAVAVTERIYDAFYADFGEGRAFLHSHTYSGNPLACAAACEVIDIMEEDGILEKAAEKASFFNGLLNDLLSGLSHVGEIRSAGLINAVELVKDKKTGEPFPKELRLGREIYKKALEKGVMLKPLGDVIYFNPPLVIGYGDMEFAAGVCAECVKEITE